ncbi:hypothetical protein IC757_01265 [Wenzhouxiangella sp. AB-CW3]|uniref:hypothetical protein n=1 Tax=Wenzhouxiangella sp. AB-CW3 TaxID=2771012 RepID=UPI00168AEF38|nr:hypothetical protein [Wenzhouxiangella sp. AB-CW3]QOC22824.1 hypothetical protein IC757_01265 [Wenzhouxiangella sp. AB-CW3]
MSDFIARLFGIVTLRLGPQDLPVGNTSLALAMLLYLLVSGMAMTLGEAPDQAGLVLALALVLPLILARIVLTLRRLPQRWQQTVTAQFGTSALLTAISLPLTVSAGAGEPATWTALAALIVFIWSFAVDAHIWRHALDTTFAAGLAVAVILFALTLFVITTLAGPL